MDNNELYHEGVKGMKWGVRRYQNKDGSLTPAGRQRRSLGQTIKDYKTNKRRKQNLKKARVAKVEKKAAAEKRARDLEKGKIPIKKMTDDEIKAKIARLELEKNYKDAIKGDDNVVVSKGKRFINKVVDSTLDKVADNTVADLIAQGLKAVAAEQVNKMAGSEIVYSNNKKK